MMELFYKKVLNDEELFIFRSFSIKVSIQTGSYIFKIIFLDSLFESKKHV